MMLWDLGSVGSQGRSFLRKWFLNGHQKMTKQYLSVGVSVDEEAAPDREKHVRRL